MIPTRRLAVYLLIIEASAVQAVTISPARPLIGKWKTPFAVTYHIRTNYPDGILQDVAYEQRGLTWTITPGSNPSTVNIVQKYVSQGFTVLVPFNGYSGDSTGLCVGHVSGSRLTVTDRSTGRVLGRFTFTSHLMKGTWDDKLILPASSSSTSHEIFTDKNALKLVKK